MKTKDTPTSLDWIIPDVPPQLYRKAQLLAAQDDMSVSKFLLSLVSPSIEAMAVYLDDPEDEDTRTIWEEDEDWDDEDDYGEDDDYDYDRENRALKFQNSRWHDFEQ